MKKLDAFQKQKYLNLKTFRRNGECLDTPVWFVQEGESLFVHTMANSGKVKRIRNNGGVQIAPCRMDGRLTGSWATAHARQVDDPEVIKNVDRLLDRKYGLLKKMFAIRRKKEDAQDTILEIKMVMEI
jgi:PPOX class probable F420-dependent enzyme